MTVSHAEMYAGLKASAMCLEGDGPRVAIAFPPGHWEKVGPRIMAWAMDGCKAERHYKSMASLFNRIQGEGLYE